MNLYKLSYAFQLIKTAFWSYRSRFIVMVVLGFAAGLFGGVGIGAVIPLFAMVTKQKNTEIDFISKIFERFFSFLHIEYNLFFLLIFIVLIFIIKAAVLYWAFHANRTLSADYEKRSRDELFGKILNTDWPYLLEQKIGYLETILLEDIPTSSGILSSLSGLIMIGTSLITYALIAFNISASITLLTFSLGLVLFFFLKPFFYKMREISFELTTIAKQVTHHIGEHIIGAKTVKTIGASEEVLKIGSTYFDHLRRLRVKIDLYNRLPGTMLEPVGMLFISAIFLFQYYFGNSPLNIATFAATVYLIQKEFSFMQSIQSSLNNINQALPHLKLVLDCQADAARHKEVNIGSKPFRFNETLELKNVSFAYNQKNKILSNLNLIIKRGEMIGLIGPSGTGKTTLVDIILRLFPLGAGEILLDGQDISDIDLISWRKKIGYVSQDTFLLNDTIENNIRFYDKSITKSTIIEVSKMANVFDFIQSQPDKFSAIVGERGVKLSGGQKQRIILARILARKPQLLILDEATSALDNESEAIIQESIERLRGKITVLIIAHRLSTIMSTDQLMVLNEGRIVEQNTPRELLKDKDSYFYKTCNIKEK